MSKHPWFADEEALDWSLVASKRNQIGGTSGDDRLTGTEGADDFQVDQGGSDRLRGLGGDDRFHMGLSLDPTDRIFGGDGVDSVVISNPTEGPTPHLMITAKMFESIEKLYLAGSQSFDIALGNGLENLKVRNNVSGALTFDAHLLDTGSVTVFGGNSADVIVGGGMSDRIVGGIGADSLSGGLGDDSFVLGVFLASSSLLGSDTITDFTKGDSIRLPDIEQPYHIGQTPGHTGDVVASYDADQDITTLSIFGNNDSTAESTIFLSGNHLDLGIKYDVAIVVL